MLDDEFALFHMLKTNHTVLCLCATKKSPSVMVPVRKTSMAYGEKGFGGASIGVFSVGIS